MTEKKNQENQHVSVRNYLFDLQPLDFFSFSKSIPSV